MCNVNPLPHAASSTPAAMPSPPADTTIEDFERPMPPAIAQQKIIDLNRELRTVERERDMLKAENLSLSERIRGFERLTGTLTAAYDALSDAMDSVTGRQARAAAREQR